MKEVPRDVFIYAAVLYHLCMCSLSHEPDPSFLQCWIQSPQTLFPHAGGRVHASSSVESWGLVHETTACLCQHLYGKAVQDILLRSAVAIA